METNKILHSGKIFAASLLTILAVSCAPSNFTSVVTEADNSTAGHPQQPPLTLAPPVRVVPDISSFAYMVIDPYSNSIILQHNADAALAPASLAKLMTAYVVAEHLNVTRADLQTEVTVSRRAQSLGGSSMFLQRNLPVTLDQLLFGLIVSSGNDAAVALAEHVAESEEEFVELMNRQVQDLGLKNCVFSNSHGLDHPEMLCSLRDFVRLSQVLITKHFDFYKRYFSGRDFTYNNIKQNNRNRLLNHFPGEVDGIKTGQTSGAGSNLIVSLKRDYRLIIGVMGASSRAAAEQDVLKLINHSYFYYRRYQHFQGGETITTAKVYEGSGNSVALGVNAALYSTLPYTDQPDFSIQLRLPRFIRAPIRQGQGLGEITISYADGGDPVRRTLVALHPVERGNWIKVHWHKLTTWFGF